VDPVVSHISKARCGAPLVCLPGQSLTVRVVVVLLQYGVAH
jgi:hypothetical protein